MAGSGKAHLRGGNAAGTIEGSTEIPLLTAEDLVVSYGVAGGRTLTAVSGVSFDVMEGETLGLVGESGCGKSSAARAVLQLPSPTTGSVRMNLDDEVISNNHDGEQHNQYEGQTELTALDPEQMRRVRPKLQMIHQDPISSLNPRRTVRDIVAEPLMVWWDEEEGRCATSLWLERFGKLFARTATKITRPLHYLMVPAWLALILWVTSEAVEERAWENALSWTQTPAQIIGFPILALFLAAAATLLVLAVGWLLLAVMTPFGLISRHFGDVNALTGLLALAAACGASGFLLWRTSNSFGGWAKWLNTGALALLTALLVGWLVVSLFRPSNAGAAGVAAALAALVLLEIFYVVGLDDNIKLAVLIASVIVDGLLVTAVRRTYLKERQASRDRAEPFVRSALETVGINPDTSLDRKPHSISGGQAQRVSIARALVLEPKLIVCDEPVSALDVSVQAQILNLLEDMKQRLGLTLVFIAHDLAVVKNVSDRVVVMYLGKLCEVAPPDEMFDDPAHPYTELLISAIPHPDPNVEPALLDHGEVGEMPSVLEPPQGCRFHTRCPYALPVCKTDEPEMREISPNRFVACHAPLINNLTSKESSTVLNAESAAAI